MAGSAGLAQTVTAPCAKVAYRSVIYAERAVRKHREDSAPCCVCRSGRPIQAYHCAEYGSGHWHIGHRGRRHVR